MSVRTRWGCLAVVAYPIVELAIAVVAASYVGWWWVFVFLVGCVVLGLGLVRYALGATGRSLSMALGSLRAPDSGPQPMIESGAQPREPAEPSAPPAQTLLIVPAGLLIAIPGLITTLAGLVLWLPGVRRRLAERLGRAARRMQPPTDGFGPTGPWGPMGPTEY